jgi:hypothetical protein
LPLPFGSVFDYLSHRFNQGGTSIHPVVWSNDGKSRQLSLGSLLLNFFTFFTTPSMFDTRTDCVSVRLGALTLARVHLCLISTR